jgi:ParB family chromosome partitioning protein
MGHARALLGVGDPGLQRALATRIAAEGWSVRETEHAVQAPATFRTDGEAAQPSPKVADAHWTDLEAQLRERLGTRVRVQDRGGRGRIVIEYFSREDCDRLLDLLLAGRVEV